MSLAFSCERVYNHARNEDMRKGDKKMSLHSFSFLKFESFFMERFSKRQRNNNYSFYFNTISF